MRSGRAQLALILVIAFATPVAATLLYMYSPPAETTNRGELVEPRPLPGSEIDGARPDGWLMVALGPSDCGAGCVERLCVMRQVRLARMGDVMRVSRLWLVEGGGDPPGSLGSHPSCGRDLPAAATAAGEVDVLDGVTVRRATEAALGALPSPGAGMEPSSYIYLVDPKGLLMMRYPGDAPVADVAKDLRRLLRLSRHAG